jgi:hypothetical protein
MRWTVMAAAMVMATSGHAAGTDNAPEPVTIRVFDVAGVRGDVLARAREIASEIYERAGIHMVWTSGDKQTLKTLERAAAYPAGPGCPALRTVDVKLALVPPQRNPGALAFARPFFRDGIRVTVAMDRVYAHSRLTGARAEVILGFVLAHEIGHVLKGTDGHADRGLMRPLLHGEKTLDSDIELPAFHPRELALIRSNLEASAAPRPQCGTILASRTAGTR